MTAKQVEGLPEFKRPDGVTPEFGFSTLRKRCSEGLRDGWLRDTGKKEDGCMVLEAASEAKQQESEAT